MKINRSPLLLVALIVAMAMPVALMAQIATPSGGGDTITFNVTASGHKGVELRVSGPDVEYSKSFSAGKPVSLSLRDLPGNNAPDGVYQYELLLVPNVNAAVARELAAARAAGNDKAASAILKKAGIAANVSQSGAFTVDKGSIVALGLTEANAARTVSTDGSTGPGTSVTGPSGRFTPVAQDQVIPDDLIVQGSGCFGFDCVNNESFGFDTIRLKENNLRIKAEDTSVGSFPTNDWQLTFNDSASGGASKFSVEDITGSKVPLTVTAGASTNSIFVDSTGRIGARTSTPVLDFHINTSNTPAIRLEQNNSGGFTAQTWDVAGNEANFFVRDVTGGSKLSFRIRPGAPTSSIDISADGDVGIGTASPEVKLHVFGGITDDVIGGFGPGPDGSVATESAMNIGYAGASFGRGAGFFNVRPDSSAVAPNPSLRFMTANLVRMLIDNEGFIALGTLASTGGNPTSPIHYTNGANTALLTTAGVWQDASSREAKENINSLDAHTAIEALKELQPVTYNYKIVPDDPKVGFIAEDVPAIVATPERNGLSALDIVAVVTKVVQEQQKTIEELNARIAELEKAKQQ